MRLFPHVHRDPDHQLHGANVYYRCRRCGAVRVQQAYRNLLGPVEPGWPRLEDRHGFPVVDTGWQHMDPPPPPPGTFDWTKWDPPSAGLVMP